MAIRKIRITNFKSFRDLIDMETFRKIEDLIENYVLAQIIKESADDKSYNIQDAKEYYRQLLEKK
jgi:hypothetical protein